MSETLDRVVLLDPSISSSNIGDDIIRECVSAELDGRIDISAALPTQRRMSRTEVRQAADSTLALVGGTNLLSSNMPWYMQWKLDLRSIAALRGKVVLMGVGWWQYQPAPNLFTRKILTSVLSKEHIHSVRDEYTRRKLVDLGFEALNTACPTMWGLDERRFMRDRPSRAVFTLTDYNKEPETDAWLIAMLQRYYDEVLVWPQSRRDGEYVARLGTTATVVPGDLATYDRILQEGADYVGTRLHGGIRAMNAGSWGLIAAVDNRALEIGRDTGLPVIARNQREDIEAAVAERAEPTIDIPRRNVDAWWEQFSSIRPRMSQ